MKKKNAETCPDCGQGPVTRTRAKFRMPLAGKWGVTLDEVEIFTCTACGHRGISIERLEPLMNGIAAAVVHKKSRLSAPEVTFLRKHIGYTGARLAKALGVTGPSVSRWETAHEPIGPSADRLLRSLVLMHDHEADAFDASEFEAIEDGTAPLQLTLRQDAKGNWAAAA